MTGKIKLVHSGGNSVSIAVPTSNPSASEVEFKLPGSDGSTNQVLKTDGSGNLSFATVADTNDFVKLQSADSTTDVSDLTFDSLATSTYKAFRIIGSVLPATDDVVLYLRFRSSSSDLTATNYNWMMIGVDGGSNIFDFAGEEDRVLISNNAGNAAYEGMRFDVIFTPRVSGDASHNNFGSFTTTFYSASSSHRGASGGWTFKQNNTVDGFKLFTNSGNISEYSYCLYGLKR